jgi:hypothetical protein
VRAVENDTAATPRAEAETATGPVPHCCRLSEEFEAILTLAEGGDLPLRAFVDHLGTRGHAVLSLLFALPFLQPVPLVGLSTPVGSGIAILGVFMALGLPPWLPQRWLDRTISSRHVSRVVRFGQKVLRRAERFIRPRGQWFHRHRWARPIAGIVIAISGAQLALPLPIVFTNTLPALVIVTTSVGMLEEDALLTLLGEFLFLVALAVFSLIVIVPLIGLRIVL